MYTFALVQTHPKCPTLRDWYLKLTRAQAADPKIEQLLAGHVQASVLQREREHAEDTHPSESYALLGRGAVAFRWPETVQLLLQRDTAVLVGRRGGICPVEGTKILETRKSKDLAWPQDERELVTISKWQRGSHWYLSSTFDRIFEPSHYDTPEEAIEAALAFVPREQIKVKGYYKELTSG